MSDDSVDPSRMEPLAAAVQAALDAAGMTASEASRRTGISTQTMSLLLRRQKPYGDRPPKIDTLQALERIPGLSGTQIAEAVAASMGLKVTVDVEERTSQIRRSVHAFIDEFDDAELHRVLHVLIAMREG